MAFARVHIPVLLMLLAIPFMAFAAAPTEKGAYQAAAQAFQDRHYARAEAEFAAFVSQFTNSTQIPEAILFQAEARLQQTNYAGAIELLTTKLPQAGSWADKYLFWLGEAHLRNGDYQQAGDHFANLIKQYPASSHRLEAAIGETAARARLGQWPRIIELLQDANGVFQIAARANATNELALRGYLLLSEAQLAQGNYAAAQAALQPVASLPLQPRLAWQRQFLVTRVHLDQGQMAPAFSAATNLLVLATNANDSPILAETYALYAGLMERMGHVDEAIDTYERNLTDSFPAERQRQALLKIAELSMSQNNLSKAIQVLDRFSTQHKGAPFRDLGLLTLGELRLRQHLQSPAASAPPATGTNVAPATNELALAIAAFTNFVAEFPQSQFIGKSELDLGWCYWHSGNMDKAIAAFRAAAEKLPPSNDQATALFKMADAQFKTGDFAGAITNYQAVVERAKSIPETRTNLAEPALYQLTRAALSSGKLADATNAMQQILTDFPTNYLTERAVLLTGQALTPGDPAKARQVFSEFTNSAPNSLLLPEVQLAIARTFERETNWPQAIAVYGGWLSKFTNSPARPRATYSLGWAYLQAQQETNAFQTFTNFVAQFPSDPLAPVAQWWVADYYYRNSQWLQAEYNYQSLYKNTNLAGKQISYEAKMMAGRTAFRRLGWKDATDHFTSLSSDIRLSNYWAQAAFAYGDVLMSQDSTNKLEDYREAVKAFDQIYLNLPTNPIAVLALGEKASCFLQWAQTGSQYEAAAVEFQKVLTNQLANSTTRAIAQVGIAVVLEKQAQQKTGPEQTALLKQAQTNYLNVFYPKDGDPKERLDLFWIKKAGLEAARLCEALQEWPQAQAIYSRLAQMMPALAPTFEKKAARAREKVAIR
jgi:TolA-binding protein